MTRQSQIGNLASFFPFLGSTSRFDYSKNCAITNNVNRFLILVLFKVSGEVISDGSLLLIVIPAVNFLFWPPRSLEVGFRRRTTPPSISDPLRSVESASPQALKTQS